MPGPILQIHNGAPFHYEVVERVIVHYREIIKKNVECKIYLDIDARPMPQFRDHIASQHPAVVWGRCASPDYFIGVTLYPNEYPTVAHLDPAKYFFISHRFEPESQPKNVVYLAPFAPIPSRFERIVLPFQDSKKAEMDRPVFVVQGGLNARHRNMALLRRILEAEHPGEYTILLMGSRLEDPGLGRHPRVVFKEGLPYRTFHQNFLCAHAILPLVSRTSHPQYYSKQLTSSVQYARAYGLQCILDRELQEIYRLPNAIAYEGDAGIVGAFAASVAGFYRRKKPPGTRAARGPPAPVPSSAPEPGCQG